MAISAVCHQLGWVGLTEPLLRIANANGKQIAAYFVRRIFALEPLHLSAQFRINLTSCPGLKLGVPRRIKLRTSPR